MGKGYEQVRKHSNEVFMFHHSISSNDGPEVGAWKSGSFGTFLASFSGVGRQRFIQIANTEVATSRKRQVPSCWMRLTGVGHQLAPRPADKPHTVAVDLLYLLVKLQGPVRVGST